MTTLRSSAWPRWVGMLLGMLLLVRCGDEIEIDLEEGHYRAYLEGGLTDTLTGPAVYRPQDDRLVGIELSPRSGPGLSIQLGPRPLRARTYEVTAAKLLEGSPADSLTGLMAFLAVKNVQLRATRGSLTVTRVDDGEVRGRFAFDMRGRASNRPTDLSVRVTGKLRAIAKW